MRYLVMALSLTIILAACGQPTDQDKSASPSPTATPSASPTGNLAQPGASASAGALPAASLAPAQGTPGATLPPGVTPKLQPTDAPPKIVDLHLDKTVVQSGESVSGIVRTSLNTASVEARIGGYGISVPKIGAGRFALNYTVPNLPFFLKQTYEMQVIARNTAGVKTVRTVPITIR